jgi:hypothetical protein
MVYVFSEVRLAKWKIDLSTFQADTTVSPPRPKPLTSPGSGSGERCSAARSSPPSPHSTERYESRAPATLLSKPFSLNGAGTPPWSHPRPRRRRPPSISASRSIEVERWRYHFLVAEPCRGRQVRLHRRDMVRNKILPYLPTTTTYRACSWTFG